MFKINPKERIEWSDFFNHAFFRDSEISENYFDTTWETKDNQGFFTQDSQEKSNLTTKTKPRNRSKSPIPNRG